MTQDSNSSPQHSSLVLLFILYTSTYPPLQPTPTHPPTDTRPTHHCNSAHPPTYYCKPRPPTTLTLSIYHSYPVHLPLQPCPLTTPNPPTYHSNPTHPPSIFAPSCCCRMYLLRMFLGTRTILLRSLLGPSVGSSCNHMSRHSSLDHTPLTEANKVT